MCYVRMYYVNLDAIFYFPKESQWKMKDYGFRERIYYYVDISKILSVNNQTRTRNNGFKLVKSRFRGEIGRNWFSNRIVDEWSRLSTHIVSAQTMGSFKRLYKFIYR